MMTKEQSCKLSSELRYYKCMIFKVSLKGTKRILSQGRIQVRISKTRVKMFPKVDTEAALDQEE